MGSKENPGNFDCYGNALSDEPTFTLLARDPLFAKYVGMWASDRQHAINCGDRPQADQAMVQEAWVCAKQGADWRKKNNGKWRTAAKSSGGTCSGGEG